MKNWWFLINLCTLTGGHCTTRNNELGFHETFDFDENSLCWLSLSPSVQCAWSHVWLACGITWPPELVWTNPFGVRPIGKRFKIFSIKNEFVTTLIAFNLNLHEKTWFWWSRQVGDDPRMNILNLMCSNGPGWWAGAQECLKHGLDASRSNLRSKTAQRSSYWDSDLINTVEPQWSIDMTDIHETHQSPQKSVSLSRRSWFNKFRHHNHDSQPKTVSTQIQNCDKPVFWPQNEVHTCDK